MQIVEYQPRFRDDFIRLNTAWIEKYFAMEQDDYDTLYHAEELLEKGAMIFFAVEGETVLSTAMAAPINDSEWEICKLATDENQRQHGAGSAVFKACMDYALTRGAKRLVIISNRILKPALHIYEKFGFREIPVDSTHSYQRADIQFEFIPSPIAYSGILTSQSSSL